MWYSVLMREQVIQNKFDGSTYTIPAGTIWAVKKALVDGVVGVEAANIDETYEHGPLYLYTKEAERIFTRPCKDLDSVYEQSFAVSEANYC